MRSLKKFDITMQNESASSSQVLQRLWILGFAGHRRLVDPVATAQSIRMAVGNFKSQVDGEVIGRSSAASGADLLFLEACRDAGMAYSVILPFPEERFRQDFESDADWARAKSLIDAAECVEIAPGHEGAPEAYHLAAREILDVSDAMLFVWDGEPGRGLGGTQESVQDTRERGVPCQIIDSKTARLGAFETVRPFPWKDESFKDLPPAKDVEDLFRQLDQRAMTGAPKSRILAAGSITLNQIATVIYGVLVAFSLGLDAAPFVKFLIISLAAVLPWIATRQRIRERWLEDRIRAELLRSLVASFGFSSPLRPFAAELFLADAAFLRSAAWKLVGRNRSWTEDKNFYLEERLDGQIAYLKSKGGVAKRKLARYQKVFKLASLGAMIFGGAEVLKGRFHLEPPVWIDAIFLHCLPSVLPAVAAWCLSMIALFEYKRRSGLYLQMVDRLQLRRIELTSARSQVTAAAAIRKCERLLLTELWEWSDARGKRS